MSPSCSPEVRRWRGSIDSRPVKMEFLCDLGDRREYELVRPNGCASLRAQNLRGTGYVAMDWQWEELETLVEGEAVKVKAKFARLGGYLLSKCVAARTRGATKDFYDLAYVLLHNHAGGPSEAAAVIVGGDLHGALAGLRSTLIEVGARYGGPNAVGPSAYAEQAMLVDPDGNEATLRADAVAAVSEFLAALRVGTQPGR